MEDISRELEREIETTLKPEPFKRIREKKVIIVDDFGEMTSGEWIKKTSLLLLFLSVIFIISTGVFYFLYSNLKENHTRVLDKLNALEDQVKTLTEEKEILTARLVISGKDVPSAGDSDTVASVSSGSPSEILEENDTATEITDKPAITEKPIAELSSLGQDPEAVVEEASVETGGEPRKTVAIEKFKVFKDGESQDLLVRFDIKNISDQPGDVAGYIFTVLRTESQATDNWLVVPTTELENGIPAVYKKGQYFSIAHYKPVKFRIQNHSKPDYFTGASIFVFNTRGELIFEKQIKITEAEET